MGPEDRVNGLRNLLKVKPPPAQNFCVVAYCLAEPPSKEGFYGYFWVYGTFTTFKEAEEAGRQLIEETQYRFIYIAKTCDLRELSTDFKPDQTKLVPVDRDPKIRQLHQQYLDRLEADLQRQQEVADEVATDQRAAKEATTIQHYTQNWYLVLQDEQMITGLQKQLDDLKAKYQERLEQIRDQYRRQPHFEDQWLEQVRPKLEKRGETHVYQFLERGHERLKDEILRPSS